MILSASLTSNIEKVNAFENAEDTLDSADSASRASIAAAVKNAYATNGSAGVTTLTNTYASQITPTRPPWRQIRRYLIRHAVLSKLVAMDETSAEYATAFADFVSQVQSAHEIQNGSNITYNSDAKKIDGTDSEITSEWNQIYKFAEYIYRSMVCRLRRIAGNRCGRYECDFYYHIDRYTGSLR